MLMSTEKMKTAVISGGTSGLGKSLVELFLDEGWNVATFGRRNDRITALIEENQAGNLLAESCDMRIEKQVADFFGHVENRFGKVDVCVMNAGDPGPESLPGIAELDEMDLRMTFETNLFASFSFLKRAFALRGRNFLAVHITSDATSNSFPGWGAYGSSKTAMDFIVRTLNEEGRSSGIRAVSIDPGDMDTTMHHLLLPEDKDLPGPDESAKAVYSTIEGIIGGENPD